ncbi:MAG: YjfB family protein [Clostridia bacterium]|nr:YjfB family protein [Clostridia bacterium]
MEMGSIHAESLGSVRQALSVAALRKSMNQDAATVNTLLNDMQANTAKIMENSVTPHKGGNIDIKV